MRFISASILLVLILSGCQSAEQSALARGPVAEIDQPKDGASLPMGPVHIDVHAADRTAVASVELSINGKVIQNSSVQGPSGSQSTFVSIGWTPPAAGSYEISVRALNSAGVSSPPARISITVTGASAPPEKSPVVSAPIAISTVPAAAPTISASAQIPIVPATSTPSHGAAGLPAPPQLVSPIDDASVPCAELQLTFKPYGDSTGVKSFDVELLRLDGKNLVPSKTWKDETRTELRFEPECKSVYDWRARARTASGELTDWSEFQTFRTGPAANR